jgi:hypothetical protein
MLERMKKPKNLPRDPNQRAKAILDIVAGEADYQMEPEKDPRAVELGRLGGQKGGAARARKLSPERRSEIARIAASKRWGERQV